MRLTVMETTAASGAELMEYERQWRTPSRSTPRRTYWPHVAAGDETGAGARSPCRVSLDSARRLVPGCGCSTTAGLPGSSSHPAEGVVSRCAARRIAFT